MSWRETPNLIGMSRYGGSVMGAIRDEGQSITKGSSNLAVIATPLARTCVRSDMAIDQQTQEMQQDTWTHAVDA